MSRPARIQQNFGFNSDQRQVRTYNSSVKARKLRFESLEDRRMLADVSVGNNLDLVNGDTSSISALIGNNGGDGISLREAILAANVTVGADVILFDPAMNGQSITLGGSELSVSEALAIDASPLATNVTINANQSSRILNITSASGDFSLSGLTLTGGSHFSKGGAIYSNTGGLLEIAQSIVSGNNVDSFYGGAGGGIYASGNVTLSQSTVSGNRVTAPNAYGAGLYAKGNVSLVKSTVTGNELVYRTGGYSYGGNSARGGGVYARGDVLLDESTVSGNTMRGDVQFIDASGGGIYAAGSVTLEKSTVSGNIAGGGTSSTVLARGGGIMAFGNVSLNQSSVSGNSTRGTSGQQVAGGGIWTAGDLTLTQSTLSGNSIAQSRGSGGGASVLGALTLTQSTVTENTALVAHSSGSSTGGGILQANTTNKPLLIVGSILSGNLSSGFGPDLIKNPLSTLTVNFSLIGTGVAPTSGGNNVVNNNPKLGPLLANGGPTFTHALAEDSPAIDAGDPVAVAGMGSVPEFDQRGAGFARVAGGRIDIGAFEVQSDVVVPALPGDYNGNGLVDAADYTVWRDALGMGGLSPYESADGDGDGMVDIDDYQVWKLNFGESLDAGRGSALSLELRARDETNATDQASLGTIVDAVNAEHGFSIALDSIARKSSRVFGFEPRALRVAHDTVILAWFAFGNRLRVERDGDFSPTMLSLNDTDAVDAALMSVDELAVNRTWEHSLPRSSRHFSLATL